jgi:hypothetical protein
VAVFARSTSCLGLTQASPTARLIGKMTRWRQIPAESDPWIEPEDDDADAEDDDTSAEGDEVVLL